MRGAQSGGVVTFVGEEGNVRGLRARVVNLKRTTLSTLLRARLNAVEWWARWRGPLMGAGRLYMGHTRFATSSKATLEGTHPHQWTPPEKHEVYLGWASGQLRKAYVNLEIFITHNGDLDFFDLGDRTYDLSDIQSWLERSTGHPRPAEVDSAAIAGLMDLLRTQGCLARSVRYGFWFVKARTQDSLDSEVPCKGLFEEVAAVLDTVLQSFDVEQQSVAQLNEQRGALQEASLSALRESKHSKHGLKLAELQSMIYTAIDAFFDNDLLKAMELFMDGAKGSFGLCVTSSLDAQKQIVMAARGQSMALAFYPKTGLLLYGSEAAAVKAGAAFLRSRLSDSDSSSSESSLEDGPPAPSSLTGPAMRLDLDDFAGEICLLDWSGGLPYASFAHRKLQPQAMSEVLTLTSVRGGLMQTRLQKRLVAIENNPLVMPLPESCGEPVAKDIRDIPSALEKIQKDWDAGEGLNRITAWTLTRALNRRLREKAAGKVSADAVDLLITGCEVSLWLGEQFAADLSLCFQHLVVKCISSNKILGHYGQEYPMAQTGHICDSWDLSGSVALLLSHSGGTFATLNVSNLLQAFTTNIFVVSSEWDTQIGKQLRQLQNSFCSRIFSEDIGLRPAEACSVSVCAMQQMLTQSRSCSTSRHRPFLKDPSLSQQVGSKVTHSDLAELSRMNRMNIDALRELVEPKMETCRTLRRKGRHWAQHVLEVPRAWILCALYIAVTVTWGRPPVMHTAKCIASVEAGSLAYHVALAFDALLYIFMPQLAILMIRLVQRRPLLHRMGVRTLVIGDVPWVAQSAEAFLSKLMACSYSATALNVFSANPCDHLVHRMTHRVVRGTLLACGCPDGRLVALSNSAQAVSLAVNQASSIQSMGSGCESLTIGHSPFKLPLAAHAVTLKTRRPLYLCEFLKQQGVVRSASGELGDFNNLKTQLKRRSSSHLQVEVPEWMEKIQHKKRLLEASAVKEQDLKSFMESLGVEHTQHITFEQFEKGWRLLHEDKLSEEQLRRAFNHFGQEGIYPVDCKALLRMPFVEMLSLAQGNPLGKSQHQIRESREEVFGEALLQLADPNDHVQILQSQFLSMQLYESRIATLQRAVSFFVMFHEMAGTIAEFWPLVSLGFLRYHMHRTQSIMRIATTASPISGADVRQQMLELRSAKEFNHLVGNVNKMVSRWRARKMQ
ncbi:unnamed protein product [Symbiodinium necroappetens]|uniref:Glutamine amidotransferase type-2 domain-containing protein n=1 Tax=Symbiodinium necroappetens TaxID=1628268 RepID=A0A813ATG2_9DINO|nr:unnamed protein product [Symbiodinium necroappetens]